MTVDSVYAPAVRANDGGTEYAFEFESVGKEALRIYIVGEDARYRLDESESPSQDFDSSAMLAIAQAFADVDNEHAMLVGTASTVDFEYIKGLGLGEVKALASGSKWLSAGIFVHAINAGHLDWTSNPQDFLAYWPTTGDEAAIELQHLISQRSGYVIDPATITGFYSPLTPINTICQLILAAGMSSAPDVEFSYGPAHWKIAVAMLEAATGMTFREYAMIVFAEIGMTNTDFAIPATLNPNVAGDWQGTMTDYRLFLQKLLDPTWLSGQRATWFQEVTSGLTITNSPVDDGFLLVPGAPAYFNDWEYANGGCWLEHDPQVFSSTGAYGWYPWVDFEHGHWGIVGRKADEPEETTLAGYYSILTGVQLREAYRTAVGV